MATANVKVTFICPIKEVWMTITDISDFEWRSDILDIEIIDEDTFIEYAKDGLKTRFQVVKKQPLKFLEIEVENEKFKGMVTGRFFRHGNNTTLDFTEIASAKRPDLKLLINSYLLERQRQYFIDLKKKLGCEEASKIQVF
ncbi:MAG: polyketide cyclase [Filifactor alocis]|nr:polyketide cyclase [Filifactor alocis]